MTAKPSRRLIVILTTVSLIASSMGMGVGLAQPTDEEGITFENQVTEGQAVTVESVTLSEGGFIGIVGTNGFLIGVSPYLSEGEHTDIEIQLDDILNEGTELDTDLKAVALTDETDNQQYEGSTNPHEQLMLSDDSQPISDTAIVTVKTQRERQPLTEGSANFQIRSVNATAVQQGQPANISAAIENIGNANGTQNVSYTLEGESISTGAGAVDIVFVLDQSGSMDDDNAVVQRELQNFTDQIEAEDVGVQYAVVEMERPSSVVQNFTSNVTDTRAAIDQILQAGGNTEDNFEALNKSLNLLESEGRTNAQQILIDITDEGSNTDEPTQNELSNRFNQTNTTYIAVTPAADQDTMASYADELLKRPLVNMTDSGVWYNLLEGDFGERFTDEIARTVVNVSRQNQRQLTLAVGETDQVSFQVNTTDVPPETYAVTVQTENDTATTTLTVDSS